jgi:hypothetical protein
MTTFPLQFVKQMLLIPLVMASDLVCPVVNVVHLIPFWDNGCGG